MYDAVFRFMYGLKYDDHPDISSSVSVHAKIWWLAWCYEISELPDLVFENLKKYLKAVWDVDKFVKVLDDPWDELWSYCIPICCEHIAELLAKPQFRKILERRPERTAELTDMLVKSLRNYSCPDCNQSWSLNCSFVFLPSFCPNCGHREQDWSNFMN